MLSWNAWQKLTLLADSVDYEIAAIGVTSGDNPLFVEDIVLPEQVCSKASFDFVDGALADHMVKQYEAGRVGDQSYRIWIHTHPEGVGCTPSGTDWETMDDGFGKCPFTVMVIMEQHTHACSATMRYRLPADDGMRPIVHDVPMGVRYITSPSLEDDANSALLFNPKGWMQELEDNATKKVYAQPKRQYHWMTGKGAIGFYSPASTQETVFLSVYPGSLSSYDLRRIVGQASTDAVTEQASAKMDSLDLLAQHAFDHADAEDIFCVLADINNAYGPACPGRTNLLLKYDFAPLLECYDKASSRWDNNKIRSRFGLDNGQHKVFSELAKASWDLASVVVLYWELTMCIDGHLVGSYLSLWHDGLDFEQCPWMGVTDTVLGNDHQTVQQQIAEMEAEAARAAERDTAHEKAPDGWEC